MLQVYRKTKEGEDDIFVGNFTDYEFALYLEANNLKAEDYYTI